MPTSGIYRYFPVRLRHPDSPCSAACGITEPEADTAVILAAHADPAGALEELIRQLCTRSLEYPIDSLYHRTAEPLAHRLVLLRNMQRGTIDYLVACPPRRVRSSGRDARFMVQAAFAVAVDVAPGAPPGHHRGRQRRDGDVDGGLSADTDVLLSKGSESALPFRYCDWSQSCTFLPRSCVSSWSTGRS